MFLRVTGGISSSSMVVLVLVLLAGMIMALRGQNIDVQTFSELHIN